MERFCKSCQRSKSLDKFSGHHTKCNTCRIRSVQKENEATRPNAHNFRETWTSRDDELLLANQCLTNKELAKLLGRTLRAIDQRKYLLGIYKNRSPEKEAITKFRWYVDSGITQVTISIEGCQLTVYSNPDAPIREAFVRDGLPKELYEQWLTEKINL